MMSINNHDPNAPPPLPPDLGNDLAGFLATVRRQRATFVDLRQRITDSHILTWVFQGPETAESNADIARIILDAARRNALTQAVAEVKYELFAFLAEGSRHTNVFPMTLPGRGSPDSLCATTRRTRGYSRPTRVTASKPTSNKSAISEPRF